MWLLAGGGGEIVAREYSEETKAAVMAALLAGQSVSKVADEYNIPPGTVRSWKSRQANGETVAVVATEKREEVGELLLAYLYANLRALKAQTAVFSDPAWLAKQDAGEVAVLHGVMTDKAVRLLEALGANNNTADD